MSISLNPLSIIQYSSIHLLTTQINTLILYHPLISHIHFLSILLIISYIQFISPIYYITKSLSSSTTISNYNTHTLYLSIIVFIYLTQFSITICYVSDNSILLEQHQLYSITPIHSHYQHLVY